VEELCERMNGQTRLLHSDIILLYKEHLEFCFLHTVKMPLNLPVDWVFVVACRLCSIGLKGRHHWTKAMWNCFSVSKSVPSLL